MSAITIGSDLVHYEVLGRGKPVILLHSWLGSWRYWIPTMQQLSVKYRPYALDLWGFGDSGKNTTQYNLEGQTALLRDFVDKMGIPKAVFIGHGLGAAVVAHFAVDPECRSIVHRIMVVAPPLFDTAPRPLISNVPAKPPLPLKPGGSSPAFLAPGKVDDAAPDAPTLVNPSGIDREKLRQAAIAAGLEGIAAREKSPKPEPLSIPEVPAAPSVPSPLPPGSSDQTLTTQAPAKAPEGQTLLMNPIATQLGDMNPPTLLNKHVDTSSGDFEKLKAEVAKTSADALAASAESFKRVNTFRELLLVTVPTLVVLGEADTLMPTPEDTVLTQLANRSQFKLIVMPAARHFPMLEDPPKFIRLLRDFLEAPDVTDLETKDEWRRRVR